MTVNGGNQQPVPDPVSFARSYQLEALLMALQQNTIVYFETGTGKTLIAIMLLRSYAHLFRKPSRHIAVFLVPTVVLVTQQGEAVNTHTDLKVGQYYGDMLVDFWDAATWKRETDENEVLVMTPQILLDALRHRFISLDQIKVLIFDECHNARGKHQYACIMREFYHRELANNSLHLPRVLGMTASPIKAKASTSADDYWKRISELESIMHSKVFTCSSDSLLTQYITFSTPKLKIYDHKDMPRETFNVLAFDLQQLVEKHELSLSRLNISESLKRSAKDKLNKLLSTFMFCLSELGVWLAMKAAEVFSGEDSSIFIWGNVDVTGDSLLNELLTTFMFCLSELGGLVSYEAEVYSREDSSIFIWGNVDVTGDSAVKAFSIDAAKAFSAHIPSGPQWSIRNDPIANITAGYLTSKITCLVETLLEYKELKNLRCIVFVERIITAVVIRILLNELLPEATGWRTEYTAGNNSRLQSQSRKEQNEIVEEFRKGTVNIIVATSMLEEGLDVQSCNLVIRFDPSATICSFIQSRGRARMQNSDFVLMVKSGDHSAIERVKSYLASGLMMRKECLEHAELPCKPLDNEMFGEPWYEVEKTGAIVTLSSSVALLHFYCSRLPSDRYFKPYPRCTIDKEVGSCTLHLPSSCPVRMITVQGKTKSLKKLACLEACKKLHEVGGLTDNLLPDMVEEEAEDQENGYEPYLDVQPRYFPSELVGSSANVAGTRFDCYLIELKQDFQYDVKPQSILLAIRGKLDNDLEYLNLDLDADRGKVIVSVKEVGYVTLNPDQVGLCQQFQVSLFQCLLKHKLDKLNPNVEHSGRNCFNYLFLPTICSHDKISVDWKCISAVLYPKNYSLDEHRICGSSRGYEHRVHTRDGVVCGCMLESALVCTPHNGYMYCTNGTLEGINGNTYFATRDGESNSYKKYYQQRHGITLQFERQTLLYGKHVFNAQNYLQRCRIPKTKEQSNNSCELPPELCSIIMSPLSISTVYSFSFLPSVMHRIESLLIAANLKCVPLGHSSQNVIIPTVKVLEAITTKKCQEKLHLESLETLGDSFLKCAVSQQLFKTYQNRHEGLLSLKREKITCNVALCKLGCDCKIPGFIRNEPFDLKTWIIPGTNSAYQVLEEQLPSYKKVYIGGTRKIKSKVVADVVEALIGAFLSAGGEMAALSFMSWLGIKVDFVNVPYMRTLVENPEKYINIKYLESLLRYSFRDASLLVEALTHGSYMRPEIPGCYQRLEFLGDAILDYLVTVHLYLTHHGLSPGLLTDLRSASVNNDCYAQSAIKAGLHKHVLHLSPDLQRHITQIITNSDKMQLDQTFGWESEITLPKVLGDVIESIAGAIFIDSGGDKEKVFQSMKPLIEPLVTPATLRLHPKRELHQLCQKMQFDFKKHAVFNNGVASVTIEVGGCGIVLRETRTAADRKMAMKLACKAVLKNIKERMSTELT